MAKRVEMDFASFSRITVSDCPLYFRPTSSTSKTPEIQTTPRNCRRGTSCFEPRGSWNCGWSEKAQPDWIGSFNPNEAPTGFNQTRRIWMSLNRIRTNHGLCNSLKHKWGISDSPLCECGQPQTIDS
ncbi:hypothetical protein J437_LFUL009856 [Ladona fulva]|uniref:Uncharacterized protein n=1 Tax=Ladona fulva TaxID=123851 RepID=A0A8K0KAD9_LADFU|nr:hypothetical protein J437_LFUL009856 [Ladona fulva]